MPHQRQPRSLTKETATATTGIAVGAVIYLAAFTVLKLGLLARDAWRLHKGRLARDRKTTDADPGDGVNTGTRRPIHHTRKDGGLLLEREAGVERIGVSGSEATTAPHPDKGTTRRVKVHSTSIHQGEIHGTPDIQRPEGVDIGTGVGNVGWFAKDGGVSHTEDKGDARYGVARRSGKLRRMHLSELTLRSAALDRTLQAQRQLTDDLTSPRAKAAVVLDVHLGNGETDRNQAADKLPTNRGDVIQGVIEIDERAFRHQEAGAITGEAVIGRGTEPKDVEEGRPRIEDGATGDHWGRRDTRRRRRTRNTSTTNRTRSHEKWSAPIDNSRSVDLSSASSSTDRGDTDRNLEDGRSSRTNTSDTSSRGSNLSRASDRRNSPVDRNERGGVGIGTIGYANLFSENNHLEKHQSRRDRWRFYEGEKRLGKRPRRSESGGSKSPSG